MLPVRLHNSCFSVRAASALYLLLRHYDQCGQVGLLGRAVADFDFSLSVLEIWRIEHRAWWSHLYLLWGIHKWKLIFVLSA